MRKLLIIGLCFTLNGSVNAVSNSNKEHGGTKSSLRRKTDSNRAGDFLMEKEEDVYFKKLVKRMKPHFLKVNTDSDISSLNMDSLKESQAPYNPPVKQFFHLHHMKTGGTSLEHYISCAIERYTKLYNLIQMDRSADVEKKHIESNAYHNYGEKKYDSFLRDNDKQMYFPDYKLSECAHTMYMRCISGPSNSTCHERISQASVMTYCAPLAVTRHFGWNDDSFDTPSVTMLRHPVDRVWSMYRFQTKHCYKCKSLKEIYEDIENGNIEVYGDGVCIPQVMNHFTRNLLTNLTIDQLNNDTSQMSDEEKVRDAIHSIKYRFTVVGIIERLEESLELFSHAFPWLSEHFDMDYYNELDHYYQVHKDNLNTCEFPHANSSPMNNGCGENYSHMEIPDHPDEETRKIIEKHNRLDIQVYEAALDHFEVQKRAMEYEEEEQLER